jgi:hypothetical protein
MIDIIEVDPPRGQNLPSITEALEELPQISAGGPRKAENRIVIKL